VVSIFVMHAKIKTLIIGLALAGAAYAGPFGLSQGMPLSAFQGKCKSTDQKMVYFVEVPAPNPRFKGYMGVISDKAGLGQVIALGKNIETNAEGVQLRAEFDSLCDALTKKYGKPKLVDVLSDSSAISGPDLWMMSLLQKQRELVATWEGKKDLKLPDHLRRITLRAVAVTSTRGNVALSYDFENFDAISAELQGGDDTGL